MRGDDWTLSHQAADAKRPPAFRSVCSGTFRVEDNDGKRPAVIRCDGCGEVRAARQSTIRQEAPVRPTDAMAF